MSWNLIKSISSQLGAAIFSLMCRAACLKRLGQWVPSALVGLELHSRPSNTKTVKTGPVAFLPGARVEESCGKVSLKSVRTWERHASLQSGRLGLPCIRITFTKGQVFLRLRHQGSLCTTLKQNFCPAIVARVMLRTVRMYLRIRYVPCTCVPAPWPRHLWYGGMYRSSSSGVWRRWCWTRFAFMRKLWD